MVFISSFLRITRPCEVSVLEVWARTLQCDQSTGATEVHACALLRCLAWSCGNVSNPNSNPIVHTQRSYLSAAPRLARRGALAPTANRRRFGRPGLRRSIVAARNVLE